MKLIRLNKEDLHRHLFRDVVFLLFSEPGAMIESGVVYLVTREAQLYGVDYLHSDVEMENIRSLFPPLAQSRFYAFGKGSSVPEGWHYLYLGFGHHMMIDESVYPEFEEQLIDYDIANEIYRDWRILVRRTLLGE